jgi:hypothetical protein
MPHTLQLPHMLCTASVDLAPHAAACCDGPVCCCSGDGKLLTMACGAPDWAVVVWKWYSSKVGIGCVAGGGVGVRLSRSRVLGRYEHSCTHCQLSHVHEQPGQQHIRVGFTADCSPAQLAC